MPVGAEVRRERRQRPVCLGCGIARLNGQTGKELCAFVKPRFFPPRCDRRGRPPSLLGLDFAVLTVALAAGAVIIAMLADGASVRSRSAPWKSVETAASPGPIAHIVPNEPVAFAPRSLPQSAPQEFDISIR